MQNKTLYICVRNRYKVTSSMMMTMTIMMILNNLWSRFKISYKFLGILLRVIASFCVMVTIVVFWIRWQFSPFQSPSANLCKHLGIHSLTHSSIDSATQISGHKPIFRTNKRTKQSPMICPINLSSHTNSSRNVLQKPIVSQLRIIISSLCIFLQNTL